MTKIPDLSHFFSSDSADQKTILHDFQQTVWDFYRQNGRTFPWRDDPRPYQVFVSEVMLQQTQTDRVLQKFEPFIKTFSDFKSLATAPLRDVLAEWQGLGYNRRGLFLHRAAQLVTEKHGGRLPAEPALVDELPGIGAATAASICAFAFNVPTVFIETNIRSVFIKVFGGDRENIDDKQILPLVEKAVDTGNPREWYYALMDYGVMIKKSCGNPNRRSKQYARQSVFEGSDRQIRGEILRVLLDKKQGDLETFVGHFETCPERVERILRGLCAEGIITERDGVLFL